MPLSPEAERYAFAWGVIQQAVEERANTATIFANIQSFAEEYAYDTPRGMFQAVNELRSLAVQQRTGAERFQAVAPDTLFTAQHAPLEINARSAADRALFPEYLARFDMTAQDATGNITTITRTMRDVWSPGMTTGDVTQAVLESAAGLASRYGVDLISVGNVRPVSI